MDIAMRACGNGAFRRPDPPSFSGKTEASFLEKIASAQASAGGKATVYDRLSPASQTAVDQWKTGRNRLSRDQWTALCRELRDLGVITQAEFSYTRADVRLLPLVSDGRGGVTCPAAKEAFLNRADFSGPVYSSTSRWEGDPLAYLDEWLKSLRRWEGALSSERWPDGERKYQDLSPLTVQADACQNVMNALRSLIGR